MLSQETNRTDKSVIQDFEPRESSSSTKGIHDLFNVGQHGFNVNERKIDGSDNDPIGIGGNNAGIEVKESPSSNEIKKNRDVRDSQRHLPSFDQINAPDSKWDMPSNVEIAKEEGELDMLLNSFSIDEPLVSSTKTISVENTVDVLLGETRPSYSSSTDNIDASHSTALDDTLDDLLAETYVNIKEQKNIFSTQTTAGVPLSHSVSKEFDDLNSWLDTL